MRRLMVTSVVFTLLLSTGGTALAAEEGPAALGTFAPAGSLTGARTGHTATLLPDGRVLIAGGDDASAPAEVWDPATASFSPADEITETATEPGPSLGVARAAHSSTLLPNGKVLVVGGRGAGDDLVTEAQVYYPKSRSLGPAGSLAEPRSGHSATFLRDGRVLVVGGSTPDGAIASAEIWTSAARPAKCFGKRPTLFALPGVEFVGTDGADVIAGSIGADIIRGGGGNDRICANAGADLVEGGAGNDQLNGGGGDDELDGGAGKDVCSGGKGIDWLPSCNDKRGTKGKLTIRENTTLKGPHKGKIVIARNKVTLDCGGHTVNGPGAGIGIWLADRTRVTVKNCDVTNFSAGIQLQGAQRNTLTRNRAHHNSVSGISLGGSNKNKLTQNVVDDNGFGANWGFLLVGSRGNVLKHNSANRNGEDNFGLEPGSSGNTLSHNTSSGGDSGFENIAHRNTFHANSHTGGNRGFSMQEDTNDNVYTDNSVTGAQVGFSTGGTRNTLTGNVANNNTSFGFEDRSVPDTNTYTDNTCRFNGEGGSRPDGLCDGGAP